MCCNVIIIYHKDHTRVKKFYIVRTLEKRERERDQTCKCPGRLIFYDRKKFSVTHTHTHIEIRDKTDLQALKANDNLEYLDCKDLKSAEENRTVRIENCHFECNLNKCLFLWTRSHSVRPLTLDRVPHGDLDQYLDQHPSLVVSTYRMSQLYYPIYLT